MSDATPPVDTPATPPAPTPDGAVARFSERLRSELVEASPDGSVWKVVIARSGWGLNRGSSGVNPRYYPAATLAEAAPRFDGAPIHAHDPRPDGKRVHGSRTPHGTRAIPPGTRVGFLRNPRMEQVDGEECLVAEAHLTDVRDRVKSALVRAWNAGKRGLELSMNAAGPLERIGAFVAGKLADVVDVIDEVASVDWVTDGAQGGRRVALVAGLEDHMLDQIISALKLCAPKALEGVDTSTLDDDAALALARKHATGEAYQALLASLTDAQDEARIVAANRLYQALAAIDGGDQDAAERLLAEAVKERAAAAPLPPADAVAERAKADLDRRVAELEKRETAAAIRDAVSASGLDETGKAVLAEALEDEFRGRTADATSIGAALRKHTKRFEALRKSSQTRATDAIGGRSGGSRAGLAEAGVDELLRRKIGLWKGLGVKAEIAESLYGVAPSDYQAAPRVGVRRSLQDWTGLDQDTPDARSRPDLGRLSPTMRRLATMTRAERADFAESMREGRADLAEALTSSDWSTALTDGINALAIGKFREIPIPEEALLSAESVTTNLHAQERPLVGGFGLLPTRSEGSDFTTATNPGNKLVSWTPADRGNLIEITVETVLKDQTGLVGKIATAFGRAARMTKKQHICDLLIGGDFSGGINNRTLSQHGSQVLYHSSRLNVGATALDVDSLDAAIVRMHAQAPLGETITGSYVPRFLVVPPNLARVAYQLLYGDKERGTTSDPNVFGPGLHNLELIVSHALRSDANNWYLSADPRICDTIELTFINSMEPVVQLQDDAMADGVLRARKWTMVASSWFKGEILEPKSFDGSIV